MAENEDVELLASDPTPVTPMYMKRTFYELGASEDEDNGVFFFFFLSHFGSKQILHACCIYKFKELNRNF